VGAFGEFGVALHDHRLGAEKLRAQKDNFAKKHKPRKCRGMESMESHEAGFPPFPHPLEIPSGFPHSDGYDDDYLVLVDRQRPPKTRNQSRSHRKGLVNHVSGLKRNGCPGTLSVRLARSCRYKQYDPNMASLGSAMSPELKALCYAIIAGARR
jgi:hypothetical protein